VSDSDGQVEQLGLAEFERYQDAEWALHDPDVQRKYEGQWVVAYQQRIIAHGGDPRTVFEAASRVVGNQGHRIVFCAPEDPDSWFDNSSASDAELPDG
jgi:hypothetical protein